MAKPKVLIFAPREEPPATLKALEGLGCDVVIGNRDWQLPRTHYEDDVVEAARALTEYALDAGGQDNITIAVIPIEGAS